MKTRSWSRFRALGRALLWGAAFFVLLLGCGLLRRPAPATPPPLPTPTNLPPPREVLREAAAQMQATGQVTLRLHESQATAYVRDALRQQQNDAPVQDVTVYFRDGRILTYATVDSPLGPLPAEVVVRLQATPQGDLALTVEKATLGGVTMPQEMLDSYLGQLERSLETWRAHYRIDELSIAEGWLIVQARRR